MPDYTAMYRKLFNAQTDAVSSLKTITENLIKTQQEVEEMYIEAPEPDIRLLDGTPVSPTDEQPEDDEEK